MSHKENEEKYEISDGLLQPFYPIEKQAKWQIAAGVMFITLMLNEHHV